jgi:hypothetical protein
LHLSHLELIDCPLPNLQISLACVISGIDQIAQSNANGYRRLQAEVSANAEKAAASQALQAFVSRKSQWHSTCDYPGDEFGTNRK